MAEDWDDDSAEDWDDELDEDWDGVEGGDSSEDWDGDSAEEWDSVEEMAKQDVSIFENVGGLGRLNILCILGSPGFHSHYLIRPKEHITV